MLRTGTRSWKIRSVKEEISRAQSQQQVRLPWLPYHQIHRKRQLQAACSTIAAVPLPALEKHWNLMEEIAGVSRATSLG